MRPLRTTLGAVLIAGAAVIALLPSSASAATFTQAGWWWRANDGALPAALPAPANVPEGGLMVAGAPDGATAIAALHFDLNDDESAPVLTLTVADNGDQGGSGALLAACVTGTAWQPASAGTWTNKPFPACAQGSVNGLRSDDGKTWTFPLAPLLSDEILDVTLVPGLDPTRPEGANGSVFQLVFNPPTVASLVTSQGASGGGDFVIPDFGMPAPESSGGASFEAPAFGGDLAVPPLDPAAGFTPALPTADQGLTATAPVVQGRNAPLATTPVSAVEDHRGLAMLVLLLCGGAALWSAQLPVPAPRRLGPFGGIDAPTSGEPPVQPGGIGRFASTRSGAAPPL